MQLLEGTPLTASLKLSVSSIGSEAMQRAVGALPTEARRTFSILNRIGGDATRTSASRSARNSDFQYPQSDRRRCNLETGLMNNHYTTPFQYPQSDRRRCNSTCPQASVPAANFQYPRSDRRRCNVRGSAGGLGGGALSVSSVGSEAMQPVQDEGKEAPHRLFQYPRSDRRRCNRPEIVNVPHHGEFFAVEIPDQVGGSLHPLLPLPNMPVRKSFSAPKPRRFATKIISHFPRLSSHARSITRLHCKKVSLPQRPQSTRAILKENLCALCVLRDSFLQWIHHVKCYRSHAVHSNDNVTGGGR